jgi:hypothetical protein
MDPLSKCKPPVASDSPLMISIFEPVDDARFTVPEVLAIPVANFIVPDFTSVFPLVTTVCEDDAESLEPTLVSPVD